MAYRKTNPPPDGRVIALVSLAVAFACVAAGCNTPPKVDQSGTRVLGTGQNVPPPPPIEADRVETRDDIVSIHQFWKPLPWRMIEDRAVGFSVPTYFISSETEKGTFVSGKIIVWLYELARLPTGAVDKQCVHVWEFDRATALGYRVRKLSVMGYYYGFALTWPPNVDPSGKEVEIVFGYERADGQVVTGSPRRLRVPNTEEAALAARQRGVANEHPAATPAPAADRSRDLNASPALRSRVKTRLRDLERPNAPQSSPSETGRMDD